jgi:hypothetical protein
MNTITDFKSLPLAARWAIVLFSAAGFGALLYTTALEPVLTSGRILLFMLLAALTARVKVNLFKGSTLSLLTSVVLLAIVREGPVVAVLVGISGVTVQTLFPSRKIVLHQLAFNVAMITLTVTASWLTYHALAQTAAVNTLSSEITATLLSSFTYFLGNSISVSLIVALSRGMSLLHIWLHHFLFSAPSFLMAGLLSIAAIAAVGCSNLMLASALVTSIAVSYYCSVYIAAERSES